MKFKIKICSSDLALRASKEEIERQTEEHNAKNTYFVFKMSCLTVVTFQTVSMNVLNKNFYKFSHSALTEFNYELSFQSKTAINEKNLLSSTYIDRHILNYI